MPYIKVNTNKISSFSSDINAVYARINRIKSEFASIGYSLDWDIKAASGINNRIKTIERELNAEHLGLGRMKTFLGNSVTKYNNVEKAVKEDKRKKNSRAAVTRPTATSVSAPKPIDTFINEFKSNYGWKEILAGSGYIGKIKSLIDDIKNGKTWVDQLGNAVKIGEFISGALKKFNNYKRIGRAVGKGKSMAWWAKSITGLKPLGRASTAKNPFTRFKNNLTNKTSPFNSQIKDVINDFKGKNGAVKSVAAWAGVAISGVTNAFSNIEEQKSSNGTMSNGRVIAETISETAVDTVLSYGAGIVAGAAVTAACGSVAVPGILVVAAGGAIVAGINAGVKALTGETTTEWVSDRILNAGEEIGKVAHKTSKSVGDWFRKIKLK